MLSEKIKEATKVAHQELEKTVVYKLKAIQTKNDYIEFLTGFYNYFNNLEQAFKAFITPDVLPDYASRRTSDYLKRDLEELGATPDANYKVLVPKITNNVEAMGALYVMEGSIMGGSAIVKMLEKHGITQGVSFFSGYGPETGEKWGLFVGCLNKIATTDSDIETAIYTANETFSLFGNVFTPVNA